jgi:hypothetical protein
MFKCTKTLVYYVYMYFLSYKNKHIDLNKQTGVLHYFLVYIVSDTRLQRRFSLAVWLIYSDFRILKHNTVS